MTSAMISIRTVCVLFVAVVCVHSSPLSLHKRRRIGSVVTFKGSTNTFGSSDPAEQETTLIEGALPRVEQDGWTDDRASPSNISDGSGSFKRTRFSQFNDDLISDDTDDGDSEDKVERSLANDSPTMPDFGHNDDGGEGEGCKDCIEPDYVEGQPREPAFTWRQTANASVHCYLLGKKGDRHCVVSPVCYDKEDEVWMVPEGERACSAFNKSASFLDRTCQSLEVDAYREFNFEKPSTVFSPEFLQEENDSIVWVPGTTLLQKLDRSCGNIAHFAGRIFYLHHVLSNYRSYYLRSIDNVVVFSGADVMKRFTNARLFGYWHKHVLEAIVFPATPSLDQWPIFSKSTAGIRSFVFENPSLGHADKRYVCYDRIVATGFFKGRFFVEDQEYPSRETRWESTSILAPAISRDSLKFRSKLFKLLERRSEIPMMKRQVLFVDRHGSRRIIVPENKERLFTFIAKECSKRSFNFSVIDFETKISREQVQAMSQSAIAIGVHGANLVNTIFMPPLSVLIELFPFGFYHDMYEEGGRASLKYFSYSMSAGEEWPELESAGFLDRESCIHKHRDCKVFYRDQVLEFHDQDMKQIGIILGQAFEYLDSLTLGSSRTTEPGLGL